MPRLHTSHRRLDATSLALALSISATLFGSLALSCESKLPPASVPGIDLLEFLVEHPTNHVRYPPQRAPQSPPPPVSSKPDTEAAELTLDILSTSAADAVVLMSYETMEGPLYGGSAFACRIDEARPPMLCTSHRVFGPASGLETVVPQEALAEFITRGFGRGHSTSPIFASVDDPLPIPGTGVVSAGDLHLDVLAFPLLAPSRIHPLPLSPQLPKIGAPVRLLTLDQEGSDREDSSADVRAGSFDLRTISARVSDASSSILIYAFEGPPPPSWATGTPILDERGEVIGVHISTASHAGVEYGAAAPTASLIEGILRVSSTAP
ncbi:MAG: hypothetical protein ACPHRO_11285 [Nannocystaceae bacterium]